MKIKGRMLLLGLCGLICLVGIAHAATTEIPTSAGPDKPVMGPRAEFNETGRFIFPHPHSKVSMLCKNCSYRALNDGTYSHEQQEECIMQNYQKMDAYKSFRIAPFCKVGNDLECGPPEFNHSNSHWECYPGYSNTVYTVYSSCHLICNYNNKVIGKIYCRETLYWHVDHYPEEDCTYIQPLDEKAEGLSTLQIGLIVGAPVIICVFVVLVFLCVRYIRKKRISRPPSRDIVGSGEQAIPLQPTPSPGEPEARENDGNTSTGDCSIIDIDDLDSERSHLLPVNTAQTQKVSISTSTSALDICGVNSEPLSMSQNSYGEQSNRLSSSSRSAASQTNSQPDQCDSGAQASASTKVSKKNIGKSVIKSGPLSVSQNSYGEQSSEQNRLSSSSRSAASQTNSEAGDNGSGAQASASTKVSKKNIDKPYLIIYTPPTSSTSRLDSGLNRTQIQQNAHSACEGSNIYFNPSKMDVKSVLIERKDDGPAFRGRLYMRPHTWTLENVTHDDAGIYKYTIVWDEDGQEMSNTDFFELFIGARETLSIPQSNEAVRAPVAEIRQMQRSTANQSIQSDDELFNTNEAENNARLPSVHDNENNAGLSGVQNIANNGGVPNSANNGEVPNPANTGEVSPGRLPPEGAENVTQQASGQGHPKFNGARPKVRQNISPVYVSGGSANGVKDPQPDNRQSGLSNILLSNNLNKPKIESGDGDTQNAGGFNISAEGDNLVSVEDNVLSGSLPEKQNNSQNNSNSFPSAPSLGLSSMLSSKNGSLASQNLNDLNQNIEISIEDNKPDISIERTTVELENLKSDEPHLDFSEVLNTNSNKPDISTERTTEELENLKSGESHLDFSEVLNSNSRNMSDNTGNQGNISDSVNNEGNVVEGELHIPGRRSGILHHLDPNTIDSHGRAAIRQEPSGRSDPQQYVEQNRHETEPKVYENDEDVRGERTLEDSSVFNQPQARVRLDSTGRLNNEQNNRGQNNRGQNNRGQDNRSQPSHAGGAGHIGQPRREIDESVQGAVGGVPVVDGTNQGHRAREQCQGGPFQCITKLKNLRDTACLQHVCWWGNPRRIYGDAKTWFGLCIHYGFERHHMEAIGDSLLSDHSNGAMYHALTVLLADLGYTVGHVVYYFTRQTSYNPSIVNRLIDQCEDHIDCRYCKELKREIES